MFLRPLQHDCETDPYINVCLWGKQAKSPEARVKELERKERDGKRRWGVEEWDNRRKWEGKEEKGVSKESIVRWSKEGWSKKSSSSMWKSERNEVRREQTERTARTLSLRKEDRGQGEPGVVTGLCTVYLCLSSICYIPASSTHHLSFSSTLTILFLFLPEQRQGGLHNAGGLGKSLTPRSRSMTGRLCSACLLVYLINVCLLCECTQQSLSEPLACSRCCLYSRSLSNCSSAHMPTLSAWSHWSLASLITKM